MLSSSIDWEVPLWLGEGALHRGGTGTLRQEQHWQQVPTSWHQAASQRGRSALTARPVPGLGLRGGHVVHEGEREKLAKYKVRAI